LTDIILSELVQELYLIISVCVYVSTKDSVWIIKIYNIKVITLLSGFKHMIENILILISYCREEVMLLIIRDYITWHI
jgi:hypothetical protein